MSGAIPLWSGAQLKGKKKIFQLYMFYSAELNGKMMANNVQVSIWKEPVTACLNIQLQLLSASQGGKNSCRNHLGCDAVWRCDRIPAFQRSMFPPFSAVSTLKMETSMEFWNTVILPHHYMASQPRRPRFENKSMSSWRDN